MNSQKATKWLFGSIPAAIVGIAIIVFDSTAIGTAIFATILSFVLLWCIYDLISHIARDITRGFTISPKEGHGRILLLLDVAFSGIVGLCTNFVIGLLLSLIFFCLYWMVVWVARLIRRMVNREETLVKKAR